MRKIFLIVNLRAAIVTLLSIVSTWFCIRYSITADYPLTLIATAIVFPIVFSINGAYKRRELALAKYAALKAQGKAIYFAARDWVEEPPPQTLESAKVLLEELFTSSRTMFSSSASESRTNEERVYRAFSELSRFIKTDLRGNGLASGEVSRCNAYLCKMFIAFEDAKHIHQYRTPRTLRMFSSVFVSVLPVLYGPYFAHEALDYSGGVIYVMPVLFTLVLVSLYNIQSHLENPFDGVGEDDISINVELFVRRLYP